MHITVEPLDGSELERLVTVLLNATGVVKRALEETECPPGADGVAVIGAAAERIRRTLGLLAEHRADEELALVTGVLAEATLLLAAHLGLDPGLFCD